MVIVLSCSKNYNLYKLDSGFVLLKTFMAVLMSIFFEVILEYLKSFINNLNFSRTNSSQTWGHYVKKIYNSTDYRRSMKPFFIDIHNTFGLGQTNWADKFWGI